MYRKTEISMMLRFGLPMDIDGHFKNDVSESLVFLIISLFW